MFQSEELENHLKYSHTIDSQQATWIEINMNQSYNIDKVGNYRYRPGTTDPQYGIIQASYDSNDVGNHYTGATDSDTVINAGFEDNDDPAFFVAPKRKINLLYSLDDCFRQNRPRSGINKLLYLGIVGAPNGFNQYVDSLTTNGRREDPNLLSTVNVARRPRYYMASRYDDFKYWTSYRTEVEDNTTNEYGIAINQSSGSENPSYYIYDAAPFVVYKEKVPTNRITVKMQTNVGEIDNGPFRIGNDTNVPDPLYGDSNATIPKRWAIQKLDENNNWVEIISFTEDSVKSDGSPIIGSNGHLEVGYGLTVPDLFTDVFVFVEEIYSTELLPDLAPYGYAYLYKQSETDKGVLYISDGAGWQVYDAEYSWQVNEENITRNTKVVKKISDPDYYEEGGNTFFREFDFVYGLRIAVDTMNKVNSTFDLIELSPRIVADISDKIMSFSITRTLSDLANHSMPTGALLASTGSVEIFDYDLSLNENNPFDDNTKTGSILSNYTTNRMKFLFYDIVKNIGSFDYYIPMKTLYSEGFPQATEAPVKISIELRDLFYFLESKKSPEILLTDVSLSYAITVLLDSVGFSNYVFKRTEEDEELIIPYFFVGPEQNLAETLQQLAISSQSAIFFDEYNNLVIMSKNYLMASQDARSTDMIIYGQEEITDDGVALPNIVSISSTEKQVYNGGEINYTTRYIQKSIGSISQAPYIDEYKTFVYKPVLLWEVAGQEKIKTINESSSQASGYSLSAMPLKTTLPASIPQLVEGELINNVIDFGENVYWLANYSGYFYSSGEIIKYDAVQYSVAGVGTVWIKNNQEYQNYFSKLRFNGKMYPTGLVRIYTNIQDNEIKEHGRGQFGTEIVQHPAGVEETTWVNDTNVRGCIQNAQDYLFNTNVDLEYPDNLGIAEAGKSKVINDESYSAQSYAIKSSRNGIIKNFMANTNLTESETNYFKSARSGSVQTSSLVFNGPSLPDAINPADFVTYSYKKMEKPYKHFGTRMRIVGKIESGTSSDQTPVGAFDFYPSSEVVSDDPSKQISISGGSGGLAFGLNKDTNVGYYFEIAALTQNTVSSYKNNSNEKVYKVVTSPVAQSVNDTVTLTLSKQHDFNIGTTVVVSGLTTTGSVNRFNGEFNITAISQDRKQFQYELLQPTVNSITVTAAEGDGSNIVYTAEGHRFSAGQTVSITGMSNSAFNIANAVITAVSNPTDLLLYDTFTIEANVTATETGASGTATYVPFNATSNSGGEVRESIDENTLISDVFFYKVVSDAEGNAIPEILYRGFTEIFVDDGKFTTQSRLTSSENSTVYDLSAEFIDVGTNRDFYLYINNKQIAVVTDTNPLPQYNNLALFVRGSSRVMFENVYALADNFAENTSRALQLPISKVFSDELITESDALRNYALSGMVQNTYLTGISSESDPKYSLFYEEFGTIMREVAYFDIKYDRAYPALYAKLAETLNRVRGYTVSGFFAGSYGAEFLIFNAVDKILNLDDTTGNYLRILGIAFTQNTTRSLTVDDFFKKNSNFTNAIYSSNSNPGEYKQIYADVQNSRSKFGNNEFSIEAQYIQTDDAAESMMDWIIRRVLYPKKTVGINVFGTPHLQLGDIVNIDYKDSGIDIISSESTRYVVYNIENTKQEGSVETVIHLAEV
jgi:hypothetical protein